MIHLFNQGQRKEFFRHWIENVPTQIIDELTEAQQIEMKLHMHFAVYSYRRVGSNSKELAKNQSKDAMNAFKSYIETKGHILSQMKEFLPYFGMPYADNPLVTFPEIFTVNIYENY
jgi:hypothetical protein